MHRRNAQIFLALGLQLVEFGLHLGFPLLELTFKFGSRFGPKDKEKRGGVPPPPLCARNARKMQTAPEVVAPGAARSPGWGRGLGPPRQCGVS